MTIFRWIMGVLLLVLAGGWVFSVMLYVVRDDDRLLELGRRLRHFTFVFALFWFNLEIWGRVVWTIVTWQ